MLLFFSFETHGRRLVKAPIAMMWAAPIPYSWQIGKFGEETWPCPLGRGRRLIPLTDRLGE